MCLEDKEKMLELEKLCTALWMQWVECKVDTDQWAQVGAPDQGGWEGAEGCQLWDAGRKRTTPGKELFVSMSLGHPGERLRWVLVNQGLELKRGLLMGLKI